MIKRFSTPDLSDLHPETFAMDIQFKSFGKKKYFCGQVMTAQCPNDNSKVKEILNRNGSGQVLVVDGFRQYESCSFRGHVSSASYR